MRKLSISDFYAGTFEDFYKDTLAEQPRPTIEELLSDYAYGVHEPFFVAGGPNPHVSDDELFRWLLWCIFYDRPREEYPLSDLPKTPYGHNLPPDAII